MSYKLYCRLPTKIIGEFMKMNVKLFNPRLPEVFRVTLLPEVGYIIPQSTMLLIWLITLHQGLKMLTFHLIFMFLRSRNPFLTFSQSCHVRVTSKF